MKLIVSLLFVLLIMSCNKNIKPLQLKPRDNYFSEQRFGANFFNPYENLESLKAAKKLGMDFIRLTPSKWPSLRAGAKRGEFLIGDQKEYQGLDKKDLQKLIEVLDMAHSAGLRVILTFLNLPGRMWKQHNNLKLDCRLWRDFKYHEQMAQFLFDVTSAVGSHPALAAINPMNEPEPEHCSLNIPDWINKTQYDNWQKSVENTPSDLNMLYQKVVTRIRKFNQNISIVLDTSYYATPWAISYLKPFHDENVFYSVHMYEPYLYSFSKAKNLSYPGKVPVGEKSLVNQLWNKDSLRDFFKPIKEWQAKNKIANRKIIIGEFGIDRTAKGALNYFTDLIDIFNENSWHWAFYSFREPGFPKMDYEIGLRNPGLKYWQAEEKKLPIDYSIYPKSPFIEIITKGLNKKHN